MPETTYVKMPQDDYVDICDAVRAKTGGSALLKSGDVADEINGMTVVDEVTVVNSGDSTTVLAGGA